MESKWIAGKDRYGHFVMIGNHRAAMPDAESSNKAAAAPDLYAFAQWCISTRFDSRDITARATAALARANGEG